MTENEAEALLVQVRGSSYRRAGARLTLDSIKQLSGNISGGCLEKDLFEHLTSVQISGRNRLITYDTTTENDQIWGVGTGCHGVIKVLIQLTEQFANLTANEQAAHRQRCPCVRLSWFTDRPATGATIGLWNRQNRSLAFASEPPAGVTNVDLNDLAALADRRAAHQWANVREPEGAEICVFAEYRPPPIRLTLWGAGDDAIPLATSAVDQGWEVVVYDPRPAYATKARFPGVHTVSSLAPGDLAAQVPADNRSYVVLMTHHYGHDLPALDALLPLPLPYLGLLGPRRRAERLLANTTWGATHHNQAWPSQLRAPVGLDLGGDGPGAVAASVIAEILAHIHQRDAKALSDRTAPIHADGW